MGKKYAADLLVEILCAAGVQRIYGITGDSANHITDAVAQSSIRFIHTRHEEVAAFAAAAEAQATGRLAVCMGSCGPGSLHLINGLYEAHRNGAPVLAIATEIPSSEIGTSFVQEIDTRAIFRGCSHYVESVQNAAQLPRILGIAMQTAIAKGGVAVVIISGDISSEEISSTLQPSHLPHYTHPVIHPSRDEMEALAEALKRSDRLTIYGGAGCRGASIEVEALSQKLKAPVVWSYRAKEYLDWVKPYGAGMNGIEGDSGGYYAINNCDTLLLLGCGFAFDNMYPTNARIIQIDIRGENLSKRTSVSDGYVGDIASTLDLLLPMVENRSDRRFAEECASRYSHARKHLMRLTNQANDSTRTIYPEHLIDMLNRKIDSRSYVTADMGTPWAFTGRYLDSAGGGRRIFTSSLHGTMAAAMPFTIGLCATDPQRQVVALCGDGGLAMLLGDLLTLKQEDLRPKIFVLNNSSLDFVSMEMRADGLRDSFTNLLNPNFATLAEAMGLHGIRVERVSELESAIDQALAWDESAVLVDVVVDGRSMLIPPHITASMVGKYSHYAAKIVFDGRAEELLAQAVTNLRV